MKISVIIPAIIGCLALIPAGCTKSDNSQKSKTEPAKQPAAQLPTEPEAEAPTESPAEITSLPVDKKKYLTSSELTIHENGGFIFSDPKQEFRFLEETIDDNGEINEQLFIYQNNELKAQINYREICHANEFAIGPTGKFISGENVDIEDAIVKNWGNNKGSTKLKTLRFDVWKVGKQFIITVKEDFVDEIFKRLKLDEYHTMRSDQVLTSRQLQPITYIKEKFSLINQLATEPEANIKKEFSVKTDEFSNFEVEVWAGTNKQNFLKVKVTWKNDYAHSGSREYYLDNGELLFVFDVTNMDHDRANRFEKDRYYFSDGRIIQHLKTVEDSQHPDKNMKNSQIYLDRDETDPLAKKWITEATAFSKLNSSEKLPTLLTSLGFPN